MFKINTEGQAFLYNLLVNSKFRIWRHILCHLLPFLLTRRMLSSNRKFRHLEQGSTGLPWGT